MSKKPKQVVDDQSEMSIGMAASSGVMWTTAQSLCGRASIFIGQLILAKLLMPEDFGVLSLATTISEFFSILTSVGIGQILQQRHPRMHLWATQAFWISLGLSSIAAMAMSIYAPIGAQIYHNPKITVLVWIMATTLPLSALSTVPQVHMQARMKYRWMASYGSSELIATQILTILFAWNGFGAISFVLPGPILAAIKAIIYWRAAPMALRPLRVSKGWDRMLKRGSSVFGTAILTTCIGQGDYITLGLLASTQVVGIYFFAYKIASQPMLMLARSFTGVLSTALIAMKGDRERQNDAVLKTAQLIGILTALICFLQAAIAGPGLKLLFGERWLGCIPLIQILSVSFPIEAISWAVGALLTSRGEFARSFKYQLVSAPFFFMFVGAGALVASSLGVAIGVALYYTLHPICYALLVFRKEPVSTKRVLECFYVPALLGVITIGGAYGIAQLPIFETSLTSQILVTLFIGTTAYLLGVRLFVPKVYSDVRSRCMALFKRR